MLLLGLGLLATNLLHVTAEAPITHVTVYGDRARITRTATLTVSGSQRVEWPRLPDSVDADSVRVEAHGAEVSAVDVRSASAPPFRQQEARSVIDALDRIDATRARVDAERVAYAAQLEALRSVKVVVEDDRREASAPTSSWGTTADFLADRAAKVEAHLRELAERTAALGEERAQRVLEASRLDAKPRRKPGVDVTSTLTGKGSATVRLSYVIAKGVRWAPHYELQLQPEKQRVQMAFSGLVSQDTGEDWEGARLVLSTARPSSATRLPKLAAWRIGTTEHFIPTPRRVDGRVRPPPPLPSREPDHGPRELEEELRGRLRDRIGPPTPSDEPEASEDAPNYIEGTVTDASTRQPLRYVVVTVTGAGAAEDRVILTDSKGHYGFPKMPHEVFTFRFETEGYAPAVRSESESRNASRLDVALRPVGAAQPENGYVVDGLSTSDPASGVNRPSRSFDNFSETISSSGASHPSAPEPVVDSYVGLAPPPGWTPPDIAADQPASLAGGYDLAFPAPRPETVLSGQGARIIPLLIESWPVQVERQAFPALAPETYLVAHLKNPSRSVLPAGAASLFVGADPAGTASLDLVVPGEPFTLPLDVDPAVRAVRNVRLVRSQEGFISKDDVNAYEVTLEVPNPYPFPLKIQLVDQWPLSRDGKVEVKLVRSQPAARQDEKTGELKWDLVVPPSGKSTVSFEYTLRSPKDWRLTQEP